MADIQAVLNKMVEMEQKMTFNNNSSFKQLNDTLSEIQLRQDKEITKANRAIVAVNSKTDWLVDQVHKLKLYQAKGKISHQVYDLK